MKFKKIATALFALTCSSAIFAQTTFGLQPVQAGERAQAKVASVKELISGTRDQASALASMYASDIDATDENIAQLASIAEKSRVFEERVIAVRLLASMFKPGNSPATNNVIRAKIRPLTQSSDKDIAVAAILRYTRLGFFSDTEALLEYNLNRGFLSNDDFHGELAHLVPFAPPSDQTKIIARIAAGNSAYALDILASNMKQVTLRQKFSIGAKTAALAFLERSQPSFSVAVNEFSLHEAIVYSDWLHTLALLRFETAGVSYDETVLTYIGGKVAQPKRAIAFLVSPEGKAAAARIGSAKLKETFDRISMYAATLPYPKNSAAVDYANVALALRGSIKP